MNDSLNGVGVRAFEKKALLKKNEVYIYRGFCLRGQSKFSDFVLLSKNQGRLKRTMTKRTKSTAQEDTL